METLLYCLGWILIGIVIFFVLVWMELKGIDIIRHEEGTALIVCIIVWPIVLLFIIPWATAVHLLNKYKK